MILNSDYSKIPDSVMNEIVNYVEMGNYPPSFFLSMLKNDLNKTIQRIEDILMVPIYLHFIKYEMPTDSIGDQKSIDEYCKKARERYKNGTGLGLFRKKFERQLIS